MRETGSTRKRLDNAGGYSAKSLKILCRFALHLAARTAEFPHVHTPATYPGGNIAPATRVHTTLPTYVHRSDLILQALQILERCILCHTQRHKL